MEQGIKIIALNKRASYDYFLLDKYEAGIQLLGTEIKSIRKNSVNIKDAYVVIRNQEAFIINMNIAVYEQGNIFNHDPLRTRKLLLHKKEILRLDAKVKEEGYTLIPTKIYFVKGKAKIEFALSKGKKNYDKRDAIAERDAKRNIDRALKEQLR